LEKRAMPRVSSAAIKRSVNCRRNLAGSPPVTSESDIVILNHFTIARWFFPGFIQRMAGI